MIMRLFSAILKRDIRLVLQRGSEGLAALFFFVLVASLFPFALGAENELLQKAAPGILWVAALLALLLSLEAVWHRDADDGTLDLLLLLPVPVWAVVTAKIISHWLLAGLPVVLAATLLGPMLYLPVGTLGVILPSLLLGTLYMSLLGAFGAALTLGSRRPGVLLAILVLPLYIPMLILGLGSAEAALAGLPVQAYLLLQLALVLAALPLLPFASARFLDMNLRSS